MNRWLVLGTVVLSVAGLTYVLGSRTGLAARADTPRVAKVTPSAEGFAAAFVAVTNRFAETHGDPTRVERAHCVQASAGHYMCSYATARPGSAQACHIMQARWTPAGSSLFTVTLAGRTSRCATLREALHSLR